MNCQICFEVSLEQPVEQQTQACEQCASAFGIMALPPATRPNRPCATCGGLKFLRAVPREHGVNERGAQVSRPMMLTHTPRATDDGRQPIDITRGFGVLEIYACYGCGRVEWFCPEVAEIPIHPHLMTEVVDYGTSGPYR